MRLSTINMAKRDPLRVLNLMLKHKLGIYVMNAKNAVSQRKTPDDNCEYSTSTNFIDNLNDWG